ncbi:methyl-accepting chemotaxis protein [Pseudomonas fulva]|nr:methyl-accepting chemotaxis protein [Pseudomonas fulva]MBF8779391.1 methyl-accepting chemotaxis protein [Pseudomonas fulva]
MNTWFANLGINLKLGLGFGLVLLLTGLLALTGWTSVSGLIDRSNWMSDITKLNSDLTNLRVARLQYMLTSGDDTAAQGVLAKLDTFSAQQQHLLNTFKSPENLALLREQAQSISDYRVSLDKMRSGYKTAASARAAMLRAMDQAGETIEAVMAQVMARSFDDATRLDQYRAASQVYQQLLKARLDARSYLAEPTSASEEVAVRGIEAVLAQVARLSTQLPQEGARVQALETAVLGFRDALRHWRDATAQVAVARQEMTVQGADIVKRSEALYQIQLERRDIESAQARTWQVGATLLAMLFGILAAVLITRQITRPLQETLAAVERIAGGDLSQQMQVTRRDELGVLQQGIARMGTTLRELIRGIRDGVTQLSGAAQELSAVTEQTSSGANAQKVETDQVATAMHEMAATVQEVARNAEHASRAATQADDEAKAGDQVVNEAIAQIERLAQEVHRSSAAMGELQQESQRIGSVMDVIKSVAEQTNLLALNAAIEAARAGEAGRGFAVVADEVRGLAQRTQQSTEEIEALIASLQSGTQQVATVMLDSTTLTDSSVELARKAGASLGNITNTVASIQAMNQQIAAAAEQQGVVAEEISRSVLNVRDVSEQTAAASNETAASSVELARLGARLQTLVSEFRV